MNYLPRCFMPAKRPNSYFEKLVKIIGLPSKNNISVIKLHLSLLSTTQSKQNCYNCFRRLQKVLIYPHNPMKKTLKSQVCVKAFKVIMFLYVFCLHNHKDNSGIWGSLVWLPCHLATRPDFLLKWILTHVLLFSKMTLINCTARIFFPTESCAACKVVYGSLSDEGKWIGCDRKQCGRWFHYKCVDVTLTPPRKWFCPDCR